MTSLPSHSSGSAESGSTPWELIRNLIKNGDAEGWERFYSLYSALILRVGIKCGLTLEEAKDALQQTMSEVARDLEGLDAKPSAGSFRAWLMRKARWRIADELRKRPPCNVAPDDDSVGDGPRTDPLHQIADPTMDLLERTWQYEWRQQILGLALEELKLRIKPKHFQIFYLHVIRGQSPGIVAKALSVSQGLVYLVKFRVQAIFSKIVKRLEDKG